MQVLKNNCGDSGYDHHDKMVYFYIYKNLKQ